MVFRGNEGRSDVRTYLTASFWFQLDIPDVRTRRRRPRVDESGPGVTLRMHYLFLGGRTPKRSVARLRALSGAVLSGASSVSSRPRSLEFTHSSSRPMSFAVASTASLRAPVAVRGDAASARRRTRVTVREHIAPIESLP